MLIRNNAPASRSYNSYRINSGALNKNLEKLSSGYKINRSADDAAGLSISEKMRGQIVGLEGAQQNAKHGIGLIQTTEGALQEYHSILNRMLELSQQSANATYDDEVDRCQLQKELERLGDEIDRIAEFTNFNGVHTLSDVPGADLQSAETLYTHYHSLGLTDGNAKTGRNATWTFADYTCPAFDASVYDTLGKQLDYFVAHYNADMASSSGWRAQVLHSNYTYMNPNGTMGGPEIKYCVCLYQDGREMKRQVPSGLYGVYDLTSQGSSQAQLQAIESGDYVRLLIGETGDESNFLDVPIYKLDREALELHNMDITTQHSASSAILVIQNAIDMVSGVRGTYGALQNRLEHTINYLDNAHENIQNAESVIRDADMANEMMKYTKNNILIQSSQAMLAQANILPEGALRLLQ